MTARLYTQPELFSEALGTFQPAGSFGELGAAGIEQARADAAAQDIARAAAAEVERARAARPQPTQADTEVRRISDSGSNPWALVHVPTGLHVTVPMTTTINGRPVTFAGAYHARKRDAEAARATLPRR